MDIKTVCQIVCHDWDKTGSKWKCLRCGKRRRKQIRGRTRKQMRKAGKTLYGNLR